MPVPFLFLVLSLIVLSHSPIPSSSSSSSSPPSGLSEGSSLSVEKQDDVLVSPNRRFTAGFHSVGENAYCFAIWFSEPKSNVTVVWMANRDIPVNGKRSKLSLLKTGNLVLTDAGRSPVWSTDTTKSASSLQLQLNDYGNLVLLPSDGHGQRLWQSFDSPTDTLLPNQPLTKNIALVSSRSKTNFSSGFYKLYFDNDNVLRLLFNGPEITSVYWPAPWLKSWEAGRSTYNNSRIAVLDSAGQFNSSDDLGFSTADFGVGPKRRLTLDIDGNIRVYSLNEQKWKWEVKWEAIAQPCKIHGVCGPNSFCTYDHESGRRCSCLRGYKMKNHTDWSVGCEPDFKTCGDGDYDFFQLPHSEFYGYDIHYFPNYTLDECKNSCLTNCICKGFQFKFDSSGGFYNCFIKNLLLNGYQLGFEDPMYIKVPKSFLPAYPQKLVLGPGVDCSGPNFRQLERSYEKKHANGSIKFMLWFGFAFGVIEFICIAFFLYKTRKPSGKAGQSYLPVATGFKRFTYAELKKASHNFSEEIGRGGGGVVYKGVLPDDRIAAIKRLKEANNQGEAEFLAEISIIGRLNHMNLIETWGYCAEGKHRLLVYEYMQNGSLAENLYSGKLDWEKRFEIAMGTAKGLSYLHEECLEWVLHCDVKPHNILLDANYNPKVADFGLSKLFNRGGIGNSSFSRIRGTRGYMAPEWVFNLPITSKVDVYSYGVVMLEVITGRSPAGVHTGDANGGTEQRTLVSWVREKIHESRRGSWIEEIVDPKLNGEYDMDTMKNLVKVALQCAEEDKDVRPTMSKVVDMLLHPENDD